MNGACYTVMPPPLAAPQGHMRGGADHQAGLGCGPVDLSLLNTKHSIRNTHHNTPLPRSPDGIQAAVGWQEHHGSGEHQLSHSTTRCNVPAA